MFLQAFFSFGAIHCANEGWPTYGCLSHCIFGPLNDPLLCFCSTGFKRLSNYQSPVLKCSPWRAATSCWWTAWPCTETSAPSASRRKPLSSNLPSYPCRNLHFKSLLLGSVFWQRILLRTNFYFTVLYFCPTLALLLYVATIDGKAWLHFFIILEAL